MAETGLGPLKLYLFHQNNSGGHHLKTADVDVDVVIEAHTFKEANDLAEAVGIYFDGAYAGPDCPCCGNRWSRQYSENEYDQVTEATLGEYKNCKVHRYPDLMRRRYGG